MSEKNRNSPAPFTGDVRFDSAGDPIGGPVQALAEWVESAALARRGRDYLIGWITGTGDARGRWARCPAPE